MTAPDRNYNSSLVGVFAAEALRSAVLPGMTRSHQGSLDALACELLMNGEDAEFEAVIRSLATLRAVLRDQARQVFDIASPSATRLLNFALSAQKSRRRLISAAYRIYDTLVPGVFAGLLTLCVLAIPTTVPPASSDTLATICSTPIWPFGIGSVSGHGNKALNLQAVAKTWVGLE